MPNGKEYLAARLGVPNGNEDFDRDPAPVPTATPERAGT